MYRRLGLNRCLVSQDEDIADAMTAGAFFIAVIPGCFAESAFGPIRYFFGYRPNAAATLFAFDFGTSKVCDCQIVTSAAALGTTGNRPFSFHVSMIRPSWCGRLLQQVFIKRRRWKGVDIDNWKFRACSPGGNNGKTPPGRDGARLFL